MITVLGIAGIVGGLLICATAGGPTAFIGACAVAAGVVLVLWDAP